MCQPKLQRVFPLCEWLALAYALWIEIYARLSLTAFCYLQRKATIIIHLIALMLRRKKKVTERSHVWNLLFKAIASFYKLSVCRLVNMDADVSDSGFLSATNSYSYPSYGIHSLKYKIYLITHGSISVAQGVKNLTTMQETWVGVGQGWAWVGSGRPMASGHVGMWASGHGLGQEDPLPWGGNGNPLQYSCPQKYHGPRNLASL